MGVHDRHWGQQALGVGVQGCDLGPHRPGDQAVEGLGAALGGLDGPGLGPALVDGEDQQAVGQLLVELGRGGRHEQRDGAGHLVGVGDELARWPGPSPPPRWTGGPRTRAASTGRRRATRPPPRRWTSTLWARSASPR